MNSGGEVDSRQYRFGFVANSIAELPADFGVRNTCRSLVSALFLPGDDVRRFVRPLFPPRLVLLCADALEILSHPASDEPPMRIALRELQVVELGHILLKGWLRLAGEGFDRTLPYNTRSSASLRHFLTRFRAAFLTTHCARGTQPASFGEELDLKFTNALRGELMPGEQIAVRLFQPPRRELRGPGPFRRERWSPGDLLAVTDRRVLWITDRHDGRREPYGTVTSFARLEAVAGYGCTPAEGRVDLTVAFKCGLVWRMPALPALAGDAQAFAGLAGTP